ncbi:MAG: NAD-dependent succinate-semialdehyde dehydrogenase [Phycisphaerae bacterium]|nr:NAD-dependent succinate-semialdehyde dehydrogenase [Phycisphaerae bacterium]
MASPPIVPTPSRCLIDGTWAPSDSGRTFAVTNPATDEVLAQVPDCGRAETKRAIEAASHALPAWRDRPAQERGSILAQWAALMHRDKERLARLMTLEQGKPLAESRVEIAYAASFFEWFAGEARRLYGETVPASAVDKRIFILPRAIGVCAAITPWNFPSAMIARKAGAALAAGCTMVAKPAEETPLSALAMGELAVEAGVPNGVFNLVTGAAEAIGDELLTNPLVRKLSFTGSTEIGQLLMRKAATNLTRLSLELGGHAPFIVFADADLDRAIEGAMASKFRNAGQTCVCANRIYVEEPIRERFTAMLVERASKLVVGDGLVDGTQIGPLIDDAGAAKALAHIEDAKSRGAKIVCGGGIAAIVGRPKRFVVPTVIANANSEMLCCNEETFGPVAPVLSFSSEADVIERANATPFGLAAYFYTRDASRLMRMAEALEYGIVGANDALPATAQAPFGGMKHSGFGKEGGHEGVEEYLVRKYVSWRL